jgi:hypothetical protein
MNRPRGLHPRGLFLRRPEPGPNRGSGKTSAIIVVRSIKMKPRRILFLLGLAIVIALATGCSIPDYQLDFHVIETAHTGSVATVDYTFLNSGSKTVYNVVVTIGIRDTLDGPALGTGTTPSLDIDPGNQVTGTIYISYSGTPTAPVEAYVVSAGWDSSKSMTVY